MNGIDWEIVGLTAIAIGGAIVFVLFCAVITWLVGRFCKRAKERYAEEYMKYTDSIAEAEITDVVEFTVYAGIFFWTDRITLSIPLSPARKEEARRLLNRLVCLNARFSFLAYGCIFIPLLVLLDRRRAMQRIQRL